MVIVLLVLFPSVYMATEKSSIDVETLCNGKKQNKIHL